jgi:glutathione synthase
MKFGFFVNDIETEKPAFTTTRLAMEAAGRGHEVWFIGATDFTYEADETIRGWGRVAPRKRYRSPNTFLAAVNGDKVQAKRILVDELDVLMLRNDPAAETGLRGWAKTAGIIFGRVLLRSGVIVLNDPNGLAGALNKMHIQLFPESIRPRTVITRDKKEVKDFVNEVGGKAILKTLEGTGSKSETRSVFFVTPENRANLNQMIEAIHRDGYIIAQEFVSGAETGSTRIFVMNGEPLRYKGKVAAFQWVRTADDMRANIHISGSTAPATEMTEAHWRIAEAVRPRLVQDGMFLAGLKIAGDRLIDIDVFSPGGLGIAQEYAKVNFAEAVIDSLENKVQYMSYYKRHFDNVDLATL